MSCVHPGEVLTQARSRSFSLLNSGDERLQPHLAPVGARSGSDLRCLQALQGLQALGRAPLQVPGRGRRGGHRPHLVLAVRWAPSSRRPRRWPRDSGPKAIVGCKRAGTSCGYGPPLFRRRAIGLRNSARAPISARGPWDECSEQMRSPEISVKAVQKPSEGP